MSSIRVRHGSATVELGGLDFSSSDGGTRTHYQSEDLVYATLRALRAVDSVQATFLVSAIESGLRAEGLDL